MKNEEIRAEAIAHVAHEANRAYCATIGDVSQPAWGDAPEWQRESAVKGVAFHLANPNAKPEDSHEEWSKEKRATGWRHGPVKDPEKKEHPCLVPYKDLPFEQQRKDALFIAVVCACAGPVMALFVLLLPVLAFAQDVAVPAVDGNAPISSFGTALLALLAALIPAIVAGLKWGGGLIAKQVEEHVTNEWARGALQRLLGEVYGLADVVGTSAESLILAARAPTSPGGADVTKGELDIIAAGILAALSRRYGGWAQLFDFLRRVGLGETEEQARTALLSHIETAVARKLGDAPASGPQ